MKNKPKCPYGHGEMKLQKEWTTTQHFKLYKCPHCGQTLRKCEKPSPERGARMK